MSALSQCLFSRDYWDDDNRIVGRCRDMSDSTLLFASIGQNISYHDCEELILFVFKMLIICTEVILTELRYSK